MIKQVVGDGTEVGGVIVSCLVRPFRGPRFLRLTGPPVKLPTTSAEVHPVACIVASSNSGGLSSPNCHPLTQLSKPSRKHFAGIHQPISQIPWP